MRQRLRFRPIRLVPELHPQMRAQLEGTLDQPRFKGSRNELPIRRSLAETEFSHRERRNLDDVSCAKRRESTICEQRLGGLVELDILLT